MVLFSEKISCEVCQTAPIGCYIADFYCSDAKLIIELDGSQHYSEEGIIHDENRTYVINKLGVQVIRFSNYDVDTNFDGVCFEIDRFIKENTAFEGIF